VEGEEGEGRRAEGEGDETNISPPNNFTTWAHD
jgi:hypothetical protein